VRIEDLAEQADVSVGTIYNYYEGKGDILIAVVAMEVEEVLASGAAIVEDPPHDTEAAILALIFEYFDHSLNYLSKAMWRSAMAISIQAPNTPNGRRYTELDQKLAQQVSALLSALQSRGSLRADIDTQAMGQLVFSSLNQSFIDFIKDDTMTLAALRKSTAAQIGPLIAALKAD